VVKEKSYFAPMPRRSRAGELCRGAVLRECGIRKDLGASSRNTGLPQLNGLESILFSQIPRRGFVTNGKGTSFHSCRKRFLSGGL